MASKSKLSKPSMAQATPLPAFSVSREKGNREQQRFLHPIQVSARQGGRNPRVFLKTNVIQANSIRTGIKFLIFLVSNLQN